MTQYNPLDTFSPSFMEGAIASPSSAGGSVDEPSQSSTGITSLSSPALSSTDSSTNDSNIDSANDSTNDNINISTTDNINISISDRIINSLKNSIKAEDPQPPKKVKKKWATALPPCRVCAQPGSGLHYGVDTCEACKIFFRRCLQRKRPLRCKARTNNCHVRGVKRVTCAKCRYQWCVTVGMSRDSIKLGRYTVAKRNENCKDHVTVTPQSISVDEIEEVTDTLLEAHTTVYTNWDMSEEFMRSKAKEAKERLDLENELLGNDGLVSAEEYQRIYHQTGLEVDSRGKMLRTYAKCLERQVDGFVHFAKGIPGFRSLPLDDQANLLKAAYSELMSLGIYRGYIHEYQTYVNPSGLCFTLRECVRALGKERGEMGYTIARKLQRLNGLTKGELVLVKAICLTSSDRCELKAKVEVDRIQWKLISVLLKSLEVNHAETKDVRFSDVIDCMMALRTQKEVKVKARDSSPLELSVLKNHPILVEVLLQ